MKFAAATLALASAAIAAPAADLAKRQNQDGVVLNFALTLEHLENAFYRQNFRRFGDAFEDNSQFKRNLRQVGVHEAQHVAILTNALRAAGVTPVRECTYNFGSLTAESFIATASVFEGVGVAAYAGAAQLITSKAYLTTAATILSVEARHSAFIRAALEQTPLPQTLDSALSPRQIFTIVAPFITSCPSNSPALPFTSFPRLTPSNSATYSRGSQLRATAGPRATLPSGRFFCAWLLQSGTIYSEAFRTGGQGIRCVVPKGEFGPMGQSYVILVRNQGSIADSNTIAGPAVINVAAPFFVGAN